MTRRKKVGLAVALLILIGGAVFLWNMLVYGFSARDNPTAAEAQIARTLRHFSMPSKTRSQKNPLPASAEVLAGARAHFADHCAECHGNDGRGSTDMGRQMYPRAPDMTLPSTQKLSDGEIFGIISNGVRLTGMPAWGDGSADSNQDSWALVHFIRHLPKLTPEEIEEMEGMNPVNPMEIREQNEVGHFLDEGDASPSPPASKPKPAVKHGH